MEEGLYLRPEEIVHPNKDNTNVNRRFMGRFRRGLDDLQRKEVHLNGHLYTWSNVRKHPTLEHIDRLFIMVNLENIYPNCFLQALSTNYSNDCPLLLQLDNTL